MLHVFPCFFVLIEKIIRDFLYTHTRYVLIGTCQEDLGFNGALASVTFCHKPLTLMITWSLAEENLSNSK